MGRESFRPSRRGRCPGGGRADPLWRLASGRMLFRHALSDVDVDEDGGVVRCSVFGARDVGVDPPLLWRIDFSLP